LVSSFHEISPLPLFSLSSFALGPTSRVAQIPIILYYSSVSYFSSFLGRHEIVQYDVQSCISIPSAHLNFQSQRIEQKNPEHYSMLPPLLVSPYPSLPLTHFPSLQTLTACQLISHQELTQNLVYNLLGARRDREVYRPFNLRFLLPFLLLLLLSLLFQPPLRQ
jgi:hypothetical protein